MQSLILYTDGGARGNPGPAALGAVLIENGSLVCEIKRFIGERQTNNFAEYEAVFAALTEAKARGYSGAAIEVRLDSMLVAEQLAGNWKVKEPTLRPQFQKVRELIASDFPHTRFRYIPRAENSQADRLVNEALDEARASN